MKRRRDLLITNGAALLLLLVVLLIGWRQEALFGLAVLGVMDLIVLVRQLVRPPRDGPTAAEEDRAPGELPAADQDQERQP